MLAFGEELYSCQVSRCRYSQCTMYTKVPCNNYTTSLSFNFKILHVVMSKATSEFDGISSTIESKIYIEDLHHMHAMAWHITTIQPEMKCGGGCFRNLSTTPWATFGTNLDRTRQIVWCCRLLLQLVVLLSVQEFDRLHPPVRITCLWRHGQGTVNPRGELIR